MTDPKELVQLGQVCAALGILFVVYLILKEIFSFLKKRSADDDSAGEPKDRNGKAGDKNTAFWELKIDKIVEGRMEKLEDKMDKGFERLEDLLNKRAAKGAGG